VFFFEKKNQKTFTRLAAVQMPIAQSPSLRAQRSNPGMTSTYCEGDYVVPCCHNTWPSPTTASTDKSLFASFSSEKEESSP
jgi:hypothetical protein